MTEIPLPAEFDPSHCSEAHEDLHIFDDAGLADHWETYGLSEGRIPSPGAIREHFLAYPRAEKSILEIGPFMSPTVAGDNVWYFDVLDREALVERARIHGYSPDNVPNIHFVSPVGDLSVVDRTFAATISSHCIEHQPDLIRHLAQVRELLQDGGRYYLMIPDKRFCFDHFIPESTMEDVRKAHEEQRRTHSLESVIEHRAFHTHNDRERHWLGDHADDTYWPSILPRVKIALKEFEEAEGGYVDVHAWQFSPDRFRRIIGELSEAGEIGFEAERVYQTPYMRNEFTAVLRATG